jgi:uncharacterized membrane protein (DUF485 family)
MNESDAVDWDAIVRDPRFVDLHQRKSRFLWSLMALSVGVWGVVNVGLLFALSEFVVAWLIAWWYSRRAGRDFDQLASQIAADHRK